jgi:GNAT superfamily N-acetyltransferase
VEYARPATAADLPILELLCEAARGELAGQRGGAVLAGSLAALGSIEELVAAAADDADRLVVVGTTDEVEVGFAWARCDRRGSQPIGVIEAIYVEPSARMVGVGEAMVDLVITWCAARHCAGVDAPALPGSRPAKAFFEESGFVTRLLVMHYPIPPSDA